MLTKLYFGREEGEFVLHVRRKAHYEVFLGCSHIHELWQTLNSNGIRSKMTGDWAIINVFVFLYRRINTICITSSWTNTDSKQGLNMENFVNGSRKKRHQKQLIVKCNNINHISYSPSSLQSHSYNLSSSSTTSTAIKPNWPIVVVCFLIHTLTHLWKLAQELRDYKEDRATVIQILVSWQHPEGGGRDRDQSACSLSTTEENKWRH